MRKGLAGMEGPQGQRWGRREESLVSGQGQVGIHVGAVCTVLALGEGDGEPLKDAFLKIIYKLTAHSRLWVQKHS